MKLKSMLATGIVLTVSAFALPTPTMAVVMGPVIQRSTYRVVMTNRSTPAVNYKHRSGATKIDFAGTDLMPGANGQAKVESKKGYIEIEVEFADMQKPMTFGTEYLTYVLWAISPEGRAVNLGEVLVGSNHRDKIDVTTDLQAFAMIVTAEPYYAVRQPSNAVVMENVIRADTKGTFEPVNAKYELLQRGGYIPTGYKFDPVVLNARLPLEFFEARNALRIAESEGAEQYAGDSYQHALQLMGNADALATRKNVPTKELIAMSREAVQTAEDARAIAVKAMDEERLTNERNASASAQANSQRQADDAVRQRDQAQAAQAQAESATVRAQNAKAQADSDAAKARNDAADAQSATAKAQSDMAVNQAASAASLAAAQNDAEQSRLAAQQAQMSAQQADTDKAAMRAKLSEQLNTILQTRDSVRGLIISMSDVLFDSGKYSLKSGAREKLAKVAGILLAYPGLNIAVGGYTDNVGADDMNQTLSENRAGSVRDYLVQQGVLTSSVTAKGFGNSLPVATNENSAGRQQNRRVELLVSGEAIGNSTSVTTGSLR